MPTTTVEQDVETYTTFGVATLEKLIGLFESLFSSLGNQPAHVAALDDFKAHVASVTPKSAAEPVAEPADEPQE
jgi:hypothetical protein